VSVEDLEEELRRRERVLERRRGEARAVAAEGSRTKKELTELEERAIALEQVMGVLNSYADSRQEELARRIETLVTHGLKTIFDDDLSFHVSPSQKGKLAALDFVVRSRANGQLVETSVMDARGGGVAAVAGFLLRLIILLLTNARPTLVLDESFAQLSAEYEPRLAEFLRELVDRTSAQVILVTHSDAFGDVADVSYRFQLENGRTRVSKI
jgi:DNA repair exonuclease SbcCD ATPase subunit